MSNLQTIEHDQLEGILRPAVDGKRRATLTYHGPRGWRMYKSQFESLSDRLRILVLKVRVPRDTPSNTIPRAGDMLGITFRLGQKKCMFATRLGSISMDGDQSHVVVAWPDQIDQVQRRVCERAAPPTNQAISVRLVRERESSGLLTKGNTVRYGQLEDLSVGGLSVKAAEVDEFEPGCTYRCIFTPIPAQPSLTLKALVRHHEAANQHRASIGLQFAGLETSVRGRQLLRSLADIVSQFLRSRR